MFGVDVLNRPTEVWELDFAFRKKMKHFGRKKSSDIMFCEKGKNVEMAKFRIPKSSTSKYELRRPTNLKHLQFFLVCKFRMGWT